MSSTLPTERTASRRRFAFAARPSDTDALRVEKNTIFIVAGACSLCGLVWTSMYVLVFGWGLTAGLPLLFTLIVGSALLVSQLTRNHYWAVYAQIICIMYVTAAIQWTIGGVFDSGFVMAWALCGPITALMFFKLRGSIVWFALYLVNLGITVGFDDFFAAHGQQVASATRVMFFAMNLGVSSTVVFVFASYFMQTATDEAARNVELEAEVSKARLMGSYRLKRRLGHGGMGEVWMAEHALLARPAAVKLIRASLLDSDPQQADMLMARFEREAQATAALRSPHSVRLYDFGRGADGSFYYVMELLEGLDLEVLVERFGPQPPERAAYILAQVCDSLAEAHAVGLVHRDIKPANIFLSRHGRRCDFVSVLDFGMVKMSGAIATSDVKLTAEDAMAGTIAYASPESYLTPDKIDARADLYSFGCVAYWLLTGKLTFEGDNAMQVAMKHLAAKVVPPSQLSPNPLPPRFEALVLACLEKDPAARPPSVDEIGTELTAIAQAGGWDNRRAVAWWEASLPAAPVPEATTSGGMQLRPQK